MLSISRGYHSYDGRMENPLESKGNRKQRLRYKLSKRRENNHVNDLWPGGVIASSRNKGIIQATLDLDRLKKIRGGGLETETQYVSALLKKERGPFM